jgi:non-ribosomal peptide synthetase-like protein
LAGAQFHRREEFTTVQMTKMQRVRRSNEASLVARLAQLHAGNANHATEGSPNTGCLHWIFEKQADLRPDATALVCGARERTYREVDREANRLARYLRSIGVKRGSFVGLSLDRSEWPIIAILAALKAGGAYVPVEPSLPDARIAYIADLAEFAVVLTDRANKDRISAICETPLVVLEDYQEEAEAYLSSPLPETGDGPRPSDTCYALFTSGSTGRPKGVVTAHSNAFHFVNAFNDVCDTTPDDRVFQGFALGFDGSVEETWMAFSNGASLICGDKDTPKFGAELGTFLRASEISFFSTVPTLLSTLPDELPNLRQLVVSGEACHPDVVQRWATDGRTMLNVYGPTEATVNTTASVLKRDRPVTIGRPLPGYEIHILDADRAPLPRGEKGELYIGGPGISKGYLKQPDLTRATYIDDWLPPNASFTDTPRRLYKTGDQVRWNDDGELEFFGRIDRQVKLRGFRVELSEIEAVITERPEIATAAVVLHKRDNLETLAAYVTLAEGQDAVDRAAVLDLLQDRLPHYMVPSYLDVLDAFPTLPSGKIDRSRLPEPSAALVAGTISIDTIEWAGREREIAEVWAHQLGLPGVGPEQDFFKELGGHSLLAAQLVTALDNRLGITVSVRDLYRHPTVRRLAAHVSELATEAAATRALPAQVLALTPVKRNSTWAAKIVQSVYFLAIVPLLTLPLLYVLPTAISAAQRGAAGEVVALGIAVVAGTWMALIVTAILAKWLLIGTFRPGRHPLWGSYYIRWWIVSRLQHLSHMSAFNGTPLAPVLWRLMGARVGRNCLINASLVYAWDCIRLGDDVSIGLDTQMPGLRIQDGWLVIGTLDIGDRCFVGSHSVLGLNAAMGHDAQLDDQSALPDGFAAAAGARLRGSPPEPADVVVPLGAPTRAGWLRRTAYVTVFCLLAPMVALLATAPVALAAAIVAAVALYQPATLALPVFFASVPATMIVFALWSAACMKWVRPRPRSGTFDLYSGDYLQHQMAELVMQIIKTVGTPIFTTLFLPPWMRLLGAKLGRHTEMSTVWRIDPAFVTAGDGVFFADGCMLGGARFHLGRFMQAPCEVGDRSFVGNSAYMPAGARLGDDCLLGVLSAPPELSVPDRTDWLGSPAFQLPNRQKVTCFDRSKTFEPTWFLYAQRAVIDALRVVLPGYVLGGLALVTLMGVIAAYQLYGAWGVYIAILASVWLALITCIGTVVGLKRLIMGRFEPVVAPLWSTYVWWNELINGLYECLMGPWVSNFFGTPFAPFLLRRLGCKIGRHCYIETNLVSEFDLVHIGDHVAVNAGVVLQNHLFEDRIMKSSTLKVSNGCTLGNMSVVLYDSVMEPGAVLGSMSLLMKGERMPAGQRWHGIPIVRQ